MARSAKTPDNASAPAPDSDTDEGSGLAQFETSLGELEGLVEALESGDISLEDALRKFERGVRLTRQCQSLLKNAELRVDQLMAQTGDDGEDAVQPFDTGAAEP